MIPSQTDTDTSAFTTDEFQRSVSDEDDIRSVLGMDNIDTDIDPQETEQEDKDVLRQDNDEEYKYKRKIYEILTLFMCCLFFFSTSYAKATAKDMQTIIPSEQDRHQKNGSLPIYPNMEAKVLDEQFVSAIAYIDVPAMFIAPFAGYMVHRYDSKISLIVFMLLCFMGSGLCSLSIFYHIWSLFPSGRLIFGLGVGCLRIAINCVIKESVSAEQLALYMQFPRTAEKSASMIDGYFVSWHKVKDMFNWGSEWVALPFCVGTALIAISLPFFVLFFYEPSNKNDIIDQEERVKMETLQTVGEGGVTTSDKASENNKPKSREDWISNPFVFVWTKMKTFPRSYWLIILISFFIDASTGTYQGVLPQFLNIYDIPKKPVSFWKQTANVRQIPAYFAIIAPVFGLIVDWSGDQRYWLLIGGCVGLVIHHGINGKKRLKLADAATIRRRSTSVHYINRFG